jgi:AcrR family transcriptional regulator
VIEHAFSIVRDRGLAALSMRRLAGDLGVVPGALYWHVASKQELLAAVAERIVADGPSPIASRDPRQLAHELRAALLAARDGAEVVSFALALKPDRLKPLRLLQDAFSATMPAGQALWAARTLIYFVLGAVAEEQNQAELVRTGVLPADTPPSNTDESFIFGVDVILTGLGATMRS